MVEMRSVRDGIVAYANERVLPKLTPGRQFVAGAAVGLVAARWEALMHDLINNDMVKASGLVAENGMVDVDALYDVLLTQMRKQGSLLIDIPMIGHMTFDESDLSELYRYIAAR